MTGGQPSRDARCVTMVRQLLRERMISETRGGAPRDIVVLGVDGVGLELARACWPDAETTGMRSVFPTTSAASWLSSLTGRAVADHQVPGVIFTLGSGPASPLVNVFTYRGADMVPPGDTVFTDGIAAGYHPCAIPADLEPLDCAWQDELLRGSRRLRGYRFYARTAGRYQPRPPDMVCDDVRAAIAAARDTRPAGHPCLAWCFVEVDRHVHEKGYDAHVHRVLAGLGGLARALADDNVVVFAHADHGLVATRAAPALSDALDAVGRRFPFRMGGAGRTRWLYARPGMAGRLHDALRGSLPESVRVAWASEVFAPRLLPRVGEVLLIATGEEFLTEPGYRYDHGSATEAESRVPFSVWDAGASTASSSHAGREA
jgi:hypothetical protein